MRSQTNPWRGFGASVSGVSHRGADQPCQDAFGIRPLKDGGVVAAVADGAGSATQGGTGARLAVQTAVCTLAERLSSEFSVDREGWPALMVDALGTAQNVLLKQAQMAESLPRIYATTLLIVAVGQTDDGRTQVVAASIGDCVAIVRDSRGRMVSLCPPQRGEYANSTHFLTQPDALERLDIQHWSDPPRDLATDRTESSPIGIALLTDGLLELAMNVAENRPFAPFFDPMFDFAAHAAIPEGEPDPGHSTQNSDGGDEPSFAGAEKSLSEFLDSSRVNARTHDDKTLVLLTSTVHSD